MRGAALWLALLLLLSGCGDADEAAEDSVTPDEELACSPANPELEGDAVNQVSVDVMEYGFDPADLEVASGLTTFTVNNIGGTVHELAFLPGGGDVPFIAEGEPDEDALGEAGAFELEGFGPGQSCNATFDLEPGTYTVFCIISTDGRTHYEQGMRGLMTVS